jgi:nucleoid-associated protein YgaU
MTVEYWLSKGNDRLRLAVNPESLQYTSPFNYTETKISSLGDVTTIGFRGLKEFTIQSFWPANYDPSYCEYSGFISPADFVSKIEAWRSQRAPISFVMTGVSRVNYPQVTIRDFQFEQEKAGEPGDIYYTLTLKEYRYYNVTKVDTSKPSKSTTPTKSRPPAPKPAAVKTYVVKKGDCLWKIAARKDVYGDGSKWPKIYNANKKVIGKNPNLIKPGQKLVIPK